jgi:4-cresol dehydrogenase (hydroxylating) flavoprotein subunit
MKTEKENFSNALSEWKKILGSERVVSDSSSLRKYATNELVSPRRIHLALRPITTEEVSSIVRIAAKYRIRLYPISTGNNWGYGASTPVENDCVIIDLSSMNRIVSFDDELGIVTLEPGVTPRQLKEFLEKSSFEYLVPVSGAGPWCSLVGNALERGYGVTPCADHFLAVTSLEAVLPNGRIYRPALSQMNGAHLDKAFKWGIGPYLDGIFSQSSFGIVTQMTIALAPTPECTELFLISLKDDSCLERAVIGIRDILKTVGSMTGMINLMNGLRVLSMVENYPFDKIPDGKTMPQELINELLKKNFLGAWTVGGIIYGNRSLVRSVKASIRKFSKPFAKSSMFFSKKKINFLKAVASFLPGAFGANARKQLNNLDESYKVAAGAPSEIALPLCYWKSGKRPPKGQMMNPALDGSGVIWYSPLVPMKPEAVREYADYVKEICPRHGIEPLITLTSLSNRCFDSTVPILFDPKDEKQTKCAKECYLELFRKGKALGYLPYRLGIDHMSLLSEDDSTFFDLVRQIKKAIDPDGIISPGRYC